MNILVYSRRNLYDSPGGDTVQLDQTVAELRKIGVSADIVLDGDKVDFNKYDLVHFFNIITCELILKVISKIEIPILISSIYVDYSEYELKARQGIAGFLFKNLNPFTIHYIKTVLKELLQKKIPPAKYLFSGYKKSLKYTIKKSSLILPNSENEYKRLSSDLDLKFPYMVVPNGIDESTFNKDISPNIKYENTILCVGRIEGRKNQLNVIKALKNTPYHLILIGKASPNHQSYFEKCKSEAGSNVTFIEHIPQHELSNIYQAARVHILASWFETTGLVSLEAAIMSCAIVVSDKGDVRDYFGNHATYCDPESIDSIRESIEIAYKKGADPELQRIIKQNYTWKKAAQATKLAYEKALNNE